MTSTSLNQISEKRSSETEIETLLEEEPPTVWPSITIRDGRFRRGPSILSARAVLHLANKGNEINRLRNDNKKRRKKTKILTKIAAKLIEYGMDKNANDILKTTFELCKEESEVEKIVSLVSHV